MSTELILKIENNILNEVIHFLQVRQYNSVILVADQNTYRVLGKDAESALKQSGIAAKIVLLGGPVIHPDEETITQVLLPAYPEDKIYLAVGSGTITDVVRFVSHRAKMEFISLPTAPSMDGYAANGSSLTIAGLKQTVYSRPPLGIFAGLETLVDSPPAMIASGFGDMLGKYTALPEWRISNLLTGEQYDPAIAGRVLDATDRCAEAFRSLDSDRENAIRVLMEGLLESGLCMLDYGNTRPASGAEHSVSHYWEYRMLKQKEPALMHGTKVGVAAVIVARLYQQLRRVDLRQAKALIQAARPLKAAGEIELIRRGYDDIHEQVEGLQADYLEVIRSGLAPMQDKIIAHWDEIQEYAHQVPDPDELASLLRKTGGPVTPEEIGRSNEDVTAALKYGFYIRSRFSFFTLLKYLGADPLEWLSR